MGKTLPYGIMTLLFVSIIKSEFFGTSKNIIVVMIFAFLATNVACLVVTRFVINQMFWRTTMFLCCGKDILGKKNRGAGFTIRISN